MAQQPAAMMAPGMAQLGLQPGGRTARAGPPAYSFPHTAATGTSACDMGDGLGLLAWEVRHACAACRCRGAPLRSRCRRRNDGAHGSIPAGRHGWHGLRLPSRVCWNARCVRRLGRGRGRGRASSCGRCCWWWCGGIVHLALSLRLGYTHHLTCCLRFPHTRVPWPAASPPPCRPPPPPPCRHHGRA